MRLRGVRVALVVALGIGCGDDATGVCATKVTPDVCQTPANLRGADPVQGTWASAPAPELVSERLEDGRYVQTALTLYCPEGFSPPSEPRSAQGVLEVSGCVLRETLVFGSTPEPYVNVMTFSYGEGGTLDLTPGCSSDTANIPARQYGFDGITLQWPSHSEETGSDGIVSTCERVDSFELR